MKKKKQQTTLKDKTIIKDNAIIKNKKAYVYFVRCSDSSLYCGYTTNLERRLKAHNSGKGAKYTSSRLPVSLVYFEEFDSKEEAMSREWHIHHDKEFTKQQKEEMVKTFQKNISLVNTKARITCKNCKHFDYDDKFNGNKHPRKPSWNHLCIAKQIPKFACDTCCKQYFVQK